MRWQKAVTVIETVLIVAVLAVVLMPVYANHARLGLDLQGGVMVRLQAPEGTSDEEMNSAINIINNRINGLGVTEPEVRREGTDRISVELPGVDNPEEAVEMIGTTAKMEFIRVDTGEVVVSGSDLKNAYGDMDDKANAAGERFGVSLEFTDEGSKKFAAATQDLMNKYPGEANRQNRVIAIVLDGEVISAPAVNAVINDGKARISGGYNSQEEVENLAMLLKSGALPVELQLLEKRTVGPQLGPDSIAKSVNAAIVGVIVLALFMIVLYRVPGVIAMISLTLYAIILAGALILIKSTITLPVIAAFLLSIGMGVDANIIIYERIKEELRAGKSLRVSVEYGFKKAFATILDSNVTTLIAGLVLIIFGTGSIRGFAITLSIGILASMFTAITFTRFILNNLVASNMITNKKFYGV